MALTDKLTAIADAVRGKTGGTDALTLEQMATEIVGIKSNPVIRSLEITENGTYTAPDGVDGYSPITVLIESSGGGATVQSGSFTPAENILEYTIPVDGTVSNFIMRKKTNSGGFGVRFLFGVEVLPTYDAQISLGSNSGGSSVNSVATANNPVTFGDGFVRIVSGASTAGLGYLVTEQYNWIAW